MADTTYTDGLARVTAVYTALDGVKYKKKCRQAYIDKGLTDLTVVSGTNAAAGGWLGKNVKTAHYYFVGKTPQGTFTRRKVPCTSGFYTQWKSLAIADGTIDQLTNCVVEGFVSEKVRAG